MTQTLKRSLTLTASLFSLITISFPALASADIIPFASGNWNSVTSTDLNGLSQTGTTNRSNSTTFGLYVKYADGSNVGYKTVTIAQGASNYHDAWGTPMQEKYGHVSTSSTNHDPWFDA